MDSIKLKHYRLYWLNGDTTDVRGSNIANAVNKAGIGQGALPALDYWAEVTEEPGERTE